jgi:HAMP domain-containing protein
MEIRTGRYTNFVLTVIAVLLAGLLFQFSVSLAINAQAQRLEGIRETDTEHNYQQARAQEQINAVSDPAVAQGLQTIAAAIRDVAGALERVAESNERVAGSIREIHLTTPTVPPMVQPAAPSTP